VTAKKKERSGGSAPRPPNAIGRIARVFDAALADGQAARRQATDPEFRKSVTKDRRAALSRFKTVRDALADRERIEKARAKKKSAR
jgi:hypothetical protein